MTLINGTDETNRKAVQAKLIDIFTVMFRGYTVQFLPNGLGLFFNNP